MTGHTSLDRHELGAREQSNQAWWARLVCGVGAVVAILMTLMYSLGLAMYVAFYVIGHDEEFAGTMSDNVSALALMLFCASIAVTMLWACLGLEGRHPARARRAGLVGAALVCVAAIAVALSPLTGSMAAVGGWGQPWMPEILIAAVLLAYGIALTWLLVRNDRAPHGSSPPTG